MKWRTHLLVVAIAAAVAGQSDLRASQGQQGGTATDAVAISQFNAAIAKYLALRNRLLQEVPGPKPESLATALTRASDNLAAAIQRSRPKARAGDLFVAPAAAVMKQRIVDTIQRENLGPVLAGIDDEERGPGTPAIHMRYPAAAPLATMPPSLLAVLPSLPKELEYRIVGNYLILRDVEAALILDIIPAAVPRKQF